MTPFRIEPATFRFVAQRLNHCATAVPKAMKLASDIRLRRLQWVGHVTEMDGFASDTQLETPDFFIPIDFDLLETVIVSFDNCKTYRVLGLI